MKFILFALLIGVSALRAAPLTVVAGVDALHWPRTIAEEIGNRQQPGPAIIYYLDVDKTTNVTHGEWARDFAASTSIHFIGLGRGASMLATLADQFPDVKIDQMTTLACDTDRVPANVLFADNYGDTQLAGAFNMQPDLTLYRGQDSPIAAWYFGTIYDKHSTSGYCFADCPYGIRPPAGFRSRRIGQPSLVMLANAKAHTIEQFVSSGSSGRYFLDASPDLQAWTLGIGVLVLDGRPARGVAVSLEGFPAGAKLFFRLRSVEASF